MGCATSKPETKEAAGNVVKQAQNVAAAAQQASTQKDVPNPVYAAAASAATAAEEAAAPAVAAVEAGVAAVQRAVPAAAEALGNRAASAMGNGEEEEEGTVDIESLLAEPEDARPVNARAARRSTDSVLVEQLDIIDYTGIKSSGKATAAELNPNVRFEVDGIRSTYGVGNNSSMDAMLKASRRAATYHGAGSGPGQAPPTVAQMQMIERRRSNLEKIQLPMLIESKEEGNAVFNPEATHQALAGLDWKQYFTQEGEYAPQPTTPGDVPPATADGVVSMEQLLDGGSAAVEQQMPAKIAGRGRRQSAC